MKLSTQTEYLGARFGEAEAIRMIAKSGFDAFDLSLFYMNSQPQHPMNQPEFREYAKSLRAVADECGIVCNQAHAPFPTSVGDEEKDEAAFALVVRAMEAAAIVGAEVIVVHPKHHLSYRTHARELEELNLAFYRRLLPYCEQFRIKVACENMWQHNREAGRIIDSTCSRPQEFLEYLTKLNSPWIVACLDVGHTALTDEDLPAFVRTLGKTQLQALHVHDNDLCADLHTMPYMGKIDFAAFTAALKEIGYTGDFTFEADQFLAAFPDPLVPAALDLLHKVGRHLKAQCE